MPLQQVRPFAEFGSVMVMDGQLQGARVPTGKFAWYCLNCRRMNRIKDLTETVQPCEHCHMRFQIVFDEYNPVPMAVVKERSGSTSKRDIILDE